MENPLPHLREEDSLLPIGGVEDNQMEMENQTEELKKIDPVSLPHNPQVITFRKSQRIQSVKRSWSPIIKKKQHVPYFSSHQSSLQKKGGSGKRKKIKQNKLLKDMTFDGLQNRGRQFMERISKTQPNVFNNQKEAYKDMSFYSISDEEINAVGTVTTGQESTNSLRPIRGRAALDQTIKMITESCCRRCSSSSPEKITPLFCAKKISSQLVKKNRKRIRRKSYKNHFLNIETKSFCNLKQRTRRSEINKLYDGLWQQLQLKTSKVSLTKNFVLLEGINCIQNLKYETRQLTKELFICKQKQSKLFSQLSEMQFAC